MKFDNSIMICCMFIGHKLCVSHILLINPSICSVVLSTFLISDRDGRVYVRCSLCPLYVVHVTCSMYHLAAGTIFLFIILHTDSTVDSHKTRHLL